MIKIDKSFIISLRHQTTRQSTALAEIAKLNLEAEFFIRDADPENAERGCFNSHVALARESLKKNYHAVLIFEDDVRILSGNSRQIAAINDFVERKHENFDLLYLGLILGKIWFCGSRSIVRARGACLHAYILSRRGMAKMANYQYQGIAIDEVVKRDLKCYSVYPMIAVQHPESATNSSISACRNKRRERRLKNEVFWQENCQKQARRLCSNIHRTIWDLIRPLWTKIIYAFSNTSSSQSKTR